MNSKVYVGNLPWTTTEQELTQEFGQFGQVSEAKIVTDRDTGRSKGFAFVTFETEDGAEKAISSLDGADFGGRAIRVSIAENKPRRPREQNFGGGGRGFGGGGYDNDGGGRGGGRGYGRGSY